MTAPPPIWSRSARPSPHGEGGLKLVPLAIVGVKANSPSPHGEGGLKFASPLAILGFLLSLPSRGGWIEILDEARTKSEVKSLPSRGGWIEI